MLLTFSSLFSFLSSLTSTNWKVFVFETLSRHFHKGQRISLDNFRRCFESQVFRCWSSKKNRKKEREITFYEEISTNVRSRKLCVEADLRKVYKDTISDRSNAILIHSMLRSRINTRSINFIRVTSQVTVFTSNRVNLLLHLKFYGFVFYFIKKLNWNRLNILTLSNT